MPKLNWISDKDLETAVVNLYNHAVKAKQKAQKDFGKNVIDAFGAMFEMAGFNMDYSDWEKSEEARQSQKTLQNAVGEFHQKILGSVTGWADLGKGKIMDLENQQKKIVAEVKNKFNTLSGGKLSDQYKVMYDAVMPKTSIYKDFTAYYVTIIAKKINKFDIPFTPSDKNSGTKLSSNKLIRHIDGVSFYELVTGDKDALADLFNIIPSIISSYTGVPNKLDLQKLQALYKLAHG